MVWSILNPWVSPRVDVFLPRELHGEGDILILDQLKRRWKILFFRPRGMDNTN